MCSRKWLALGLLWLTSLAGQAPKGTIPKPSADRYPVHADQNGISIGAAALTPGQTRKTFAVDLNSCCIVVEVALYPRKDGTLEVSLDDFALREAGKDLGIKPSTAEMIAVTLQREPPVLPDEPASVHGSVGGSIGNGGVDPVTGRPTRGRSASTDSELKIGMGGGPAPPQDTGSKDAARHVIQRDLQDKGLAEGKTSAPVAGYLYFLMSNKKKAKHDLMYKIDGTPGVLPLP